VFVIVRLFQPSLKFGCKTVAYKNSFSSAHQFEEYDAKANVTDTNKHSILSLKKDFFRKIELDWLIVLFLWTKVNFFAAT